MIYIKNKSKLKTIESYINLAAGFAKYSECKKSQRGVVIVKNDSVIGIGYNLPMKKELCCAREKIHDNRTAELCSAIHAEEMAIIDALKKSYSLSGSRLYYIKLKDGKISPSGNPSCTRCSTKILYSGISEVVLLHKEGYAVYYSKEFNDLSFNYFLKKK